MNKLHAVLRQRGTPVPLGVVDKWARGQELITTHKDRRLRPRRYRNVVVRTIGKLWDADLMEMSKLRFRDNFPIKFVLVCTDAFSRFCYTVPLERKKASDTAEDLLDDAP